MSVFFSSDQHWGDERACTWRYRPFSSVDEMNGEMVRLWNETVAPGDEVFHLGDFAVTDDAVEEFAPLLNGDITLVIGNHDHTRDRSILERHFEVRDDPFVVDLEGGHLFLCHYPLQRRRRIFSVCGHIHEAYRVARGLLNVGVDAWHFRPVPLDAVWEYKSRQDRGAFDGNVYPDADLDFRYAQSTMKPRPDWEPTLKILERERGWVRAAERMGRTCDW